MKCSTRKTLSLVRVLLVSVRTWPEYLTQAIRAKPKKAGLSWVLNARSASDVWQWQARNYYFSQCHARWCRPIRSNELFLVMQPYDQKVAVNSFVWNDKRGSSECLCALPRAQTAEHFETPVLSKGCCNKCDRGLSAKATVQFEFATRVANHHTEHISESDVRNNGRHHSTFAENKILQILPPIVAQEDEMPVQKMRSPCVHRPIPTFPQ